MLGPNNVIDHPARDVEPVSTVILSVPEMTEAAVRLAPFESCANIVAKLHQSIKRDAEREMALQRAKEKK